MQIDIAHRIPNAEAAVVLLRDAHAHVRNPAVHALPKSLTQRPYRFGLFAAVPVLIVLAAGAAYAWSNIAANHKVDAAISNTPRSAPAQNAGDGDSYPWHDSAADFELQSIQVKLAELASELESDAGIELQPQTAPLEPLEYGEQIDVAE
jgi:hypothetical protein